MAEAPSSRPASRQEITARRRARRRTRRRRRFYPAFAVALVGLLLLISVVGAATTPGNEDFKSKWADWLRSHHAAALVTPLESWYYAHSAPKKGGRPASLNALPGRPGVTDDPEATTSTPPSGGGASSPTSDPASASATATASAATTTASAATTTTAAATTAPAPRTAPAATTATVPAVNGPMHLAAPAAVPLVVSPALVGEGQWLPVGPLMDGVSAMYEAQFRADDVYTSQITSAVWVDPTLLHISLVPGATEPGGTWPEPPDLTGAAALAAVAAFNGGFRFADAHGGFYLDGRTAVPLQVGAASVVIYANGRVDIGAWGTEVTMTPGVTAVLQNLVPIVDKGQPAPNATYADASIWGDTLGASTVVARSGLGVTADGGLVYVAGPALTAKSLAESLQRCGVVRAMTLDLNPEWVTFNFFSHDATGDVTGTKLYPQMQRPADRYLGPTRESRDFFVVST